MNRIITYAVHRENGAVISRVGSYLAWPVLDYATIGRGGGGYQPGDFRGPMKYRLEKTPLTSVGSQWVMLKWTKKIPLRLKNRHRRFWGFSPLKGARRAA